MSRVANYVQNLSEIEQYADAPMTSIVGASRVIDDLARCRRPILRGTI